MHFLFGALQQVVVCLEQIFRNTSSEFGKQRSNSLPGIQRRLDGWILDVCETRIPQILLRIFVVAQGNTWLFDPCSRCCFGTRQSQEFLACWRWQVCSGFKQWWWTALNCQQPEHLVISWFQVFAVTSGNGHVIVRGKSDILINGKSSSLLEVIILICSNRHYLIYVLDRIIFAISFWFSSLDYLVIFDPRRLQKRPW